ncbi:MAG: hypothetical protein HQK60_12025 [Deltaproteobacteria bacterium]|nr:hypothetical protein [Deltaproteobacteria bacterium]
MLRRATLAFLNAILVEEIIWRNTGKSDVGAEKSKVGDLLIKLDRENMLRGNDILKRNIFLITEGSEDKSRVNQYPFFQYWVNCPLLWLLLSPIDQNILKGMDGLFPEIKVTQVSGQPIIWKTGNDINKDPKPIDVVVEQGNYSLYTLLCSLGPTPPMRNDEDRKKGEEKAKKRWTASLRCIRCK